MSLLAAVNRDVWSPIWPNLAASGICTTVAVMRVRVHLRQHREALTEQHAETHRLVAGLNDRLDGIDAQRKDTP